ncbi:MAG: redoxin family protein [Verrucomicrobia bacterium]|nr:redoxin family protein [Verrucomicrobiota bacterium]
MKKTFLTLALLAVATTAYLAYGQVVDLKERFDHYDSNKDGQISGEEMSTAPMLKKLDLDGNGSLTMIEAAKALKGKLSPRKSDSETSPSESGNERGLFDQLDKNKDGKLSSEEVPKKQWFSRLDRDGDGQVTFTEASAVVAEMRERGENLPRLPGTPSPPAPTPGPSAEKAELTEAPTILKGTTIGVGHLVDDLVMTDLAGTEQKLSERVKGSQGIILAYFGATCPISGKLGPELARLEKDAAEKQIGFALICPVKTESKEDIQKFLSTHALKSPVIHDQDGLITSTLGATTTTEVFLIDSARTLIYRGAINDQYGLGYSKDKAIKHYLRDAMTALLSNRRPDIAATTAPGCALDTPKQTTAAATGATYHQHISRILQTHCVECHHSKGVGPFSLTSYEDVIENAAMIRKQVERGAMPPWFAAAQPDEKHSPWINDASLTEEDKSTLLSWLASDRPSGDASLAPKPLSFPEDWVIGTPDAIVQLPAPVSIKAEGTMPYQFITAKTTFEEDRWVQGYEIQPSDKSVVHHVIVQVHTKGSKARDRDEGREGYWAAYVPGNTHHQWPAGYAKKLPAGATVSFQIHYTPNGKATKDQLKMGLIFAKEPPTYVVHTAAVSNPRLKIPAGEANHVEVKTQNVPMDMHVMAYVAHMHVRGKAFKFEITPPGGSPEVVLDMPRYDFNWQLRYNYTQPRLLTQGSQVKITAIYDNSTANPANPDPTKTVRWGPQTSDEMMIGYIEYFTPNTGGVAME